MGSPPEISGVHRQLFIPDRRHSLFSPAERANPKKKSYFLIYFLVVLGLCSCLQAFSSCSEQGLLFVAVQGFSLWWLLVAEHRL